MLSELGERELKALAECIKERTVPAGEVLLNEGRGGIGFFIILEGEAEVSVRGQTIATLGPGDHVGEVALFDLSSDRVATVTAKTDLRCGGLSVWTFRPFLRDNPDIAWKLLTTLAKRLRESEDRHLAALAESG